MLYALSIRPEPFSMASDSMQVFTPEEQKQLPKHIAIIMDGNGRWAKSLGKPRLFGHRNGVKNVRDIVNAARAIGIPYVTLYAFSQENQNRPSEEKSGLMKLLQEFIKIELNGMQRDGIRLRAIGDLRGLPDYARKAVEDAIEKTRAQIRKALESKYAKSLKDYQKRIEKKVRDTAKLVEKKEKGFLLLTQGL